MGTRHMIILKVDKKKVLSQYGQWDGYPTGQGKDLVDGLHAILRGFNSSKSLNKFRKYAKELGEYTEKELKALYKSLSDKFEGRTEDGMVNMGSPYDKAIQQFHPELHRDTGASIITYIYSGTIKKVPNQSDDSFRDDGLFCEWAYELDLDKEVLRIYKNGRTLKKTLKFSEIMADIDLVYKTLEKLEG